MRRRDLLGLGAAALPALALRAAQAQARFPERPIRLVIPFPPGGVYDAIGRPWADRVKAHLGTVIIENQGGSGGALGAAAVTRARPDGYTILLQGPAINVINWVAVTRPLYDPGDLAPIALLGSARFAIAVHPAVPAKTLAEFIAYAKVNPGKLSYASAGTGSLNHLTGEWFKSLSGTDITHVPYRGTGPALTDLISGQVAMIVPAVTGQVAELHQAGKLRILAITGDPHIAVLPHIPTTVEAGLPELVSQQYIGLYAPAGTPGAIIAQISDAARAAMADAEFRAVLTAIGFAPTDDTSPQTMRAVVAQEFAHWTPVIRAIGLRLE
jgi:tripartite-type tricarboxylate transporter receptor subunit TctC